MAEKQKLKAGVTIVWGTTEAVSAGTQGLGKLISCRVRRSSQKVTEPDEDGSTCAVVYFDETDTIVMEINCKSGMTDPEIGDTIAGGGRTGYVEDFEKRWEAKGVKRISVTASRFVSGGIPAQ